MKAGGDHVVSALKLQLNQIWEKEEVPEDWKVAHIVPLFKKGNPAECGNYRGISLLSIAGKVFASILRDRLSPLRELQAREEQAGFRPGRGCADQIFSLRQLLQERIRAGKRTVVTFVDFACAFDSIDRPSMLLALRSAGVPEKLIRLIETVYEGSTSRVIANGELTDAFEIHCGVRQGCVLSPLLFNVMMDHVMGKVFSKRRGVEVGQGDFFTDLLYADDSAFFTETDEEAETILNEIAVVGEKVGLRINAAKTKVLTSDGSIASINLNGEPIEQVENFKYLGTVIPTKVVSASTEITQRIGAAASAFARLNWSVWSRNNIRLATKLRIFNASILPILLYSSETWTILKVDLNKLEVFFMRCLRRILGITLWDRWTNEEVRKRCQIKHTIEQQIQLRRMKLFGHVARMDGRRLPCRLLMPTRPDGWKISCSAPKKTWLSQIANDFNSIQFKPEGARIAALNRQQFRAMVRDATTMAAPAKTVKFLR